MFNKQEILKFLNNKKELDKSIEELKQDFRSENEVMFDYLEEQIYDVYTDFPIGGEIRDFYIDEEGLIQVETGSRYDGENSYGLEINENGELSGDD